MVMFHKAAIAMRAIERKAGFVGFEGSDMLSAAARPRIVVVEDDEAMQRLIVAYLGEHNMLARAVTGQQGLWHAFAVREPQLVILDLNLGEEDGFDLLRDLRAKSVVPVLVVTGHRQEEVDRVLGLELGADDYITKPFGLRELLARVRALLRRRAMDRLRPVRLEERRYGFNGWQFDQRERVLCNSLGEIVPLTRSEFALLSVFVAEPRRPLSREQLLQATRIYENVVDRSIDVQILRLRRKLAQDSHAPTVIRTQRGVGYIFDAEVSVA